MVTNTKFKMGSLIEIGGEIFHLFDPMETLCIVESNQKRSLKIKNIVQYALIVDRNMRKISTGNPLLKSRWIYLQQS